MISWFLIAVVVIGVLLLFRFTEMKHKFRLVILLAIFAFVLFTAIHVYTSSNVDLGTFEGVVEAGRIYLLWLGDSITNVVKISGYAIHQNWGLNTTNSTLR